MEEGRETSESEDNEEAVEAPVAFEDQPEARSQQHGAGRENEQDVEPVHVANEGDGAGTVPAAQGERPETEHHRLAPEPDARAKDVKEEKDPVEGDHRSTIQAARPSFQAVLSSRHQSAR